MSSIVPLRLLEFHVTHHCNLTCTGCSHFAPTAPKWFAEPSELENDVQLSSLILDPQVIHVLGGEPLLHPHINSLIPIFRCAFPQAVIKLVTNGVLITRKADLLFPVLAANIVQIAVSVYPSVMLQRETIVDLCEKYQVIVEFWEQPTFLDFIDPQGLSNPVEARKACPMEDACNVRNGRLYPCPVTAWADFGSLPFSEDNGIHLSDTAALQMILDRSRITSCCRYCRSSPPRVPHTMRRRETITLTTR